MDEKAWRRWKLGVLLDKRQKRHGREESLFFLECVEALGEGTRICSREESERLYAKLQKEYPFTSYGRIDWAQVPHQDVSVSDGDLGATGALEYWVLWSHGNDPVLRTSLRRLLERLDEVTAVSPDMWAYREDEEVWEWFHDGTCRRSRRK
ncbi:hypothetical protein ACP26L_23540 [Paenibacillus sp. S-38]|uniref:CDI toxin immunity protein n=1 Tax=Paenibacillus sp. S-38 TaxID=3416710 RepID=UPI003CF11547